MLEHNDDWRAILENAVASFRHKLVLIVFTPLVAETHVYSESADLGVPDIAFREDDLTCFFNGLTWQRRAVASDTQYGQETLFYVRR